ncbi:hypothetical protein [Edaphobacter bradus]|uniref:hypothetical protein n=1 Tax=Edaphobacter bradus TaxID=2259016 RepID=UPI0021DF55B6|nr:hypothetical protein [Edaphobacter bradus]
MHRLRALTLALAVLALSAQLTFAQHDDMPGMQMPMHSSPKSPDNETPMQMDMPISAATLIEAQLNHASSGTSIEPASTSVPMLMGSYKNWMLMLHGTAFITDIQQSGPRGTDKLFSTNWIMPMAMRQLGPGELSLRAMFSLEPATITGRQYPLLFQQGETAFGKPIIDGQHPHNFFMEVAALYDIHLGERSLLSLYAAPVGDPAIGPTAYPHRLSASENPLAALGHHQEDSTHIAYNVLTAGLTFHSVRVEASGFHGAEPTEQRWGFQPSPNGHAIDSYSSRITFSPRPNWSAQYSIAHLNSPESLYPNDAQQRQTASIMYNRPLHNGNWSNTLVWGRTKSLSDHSKENSYLLESLIKFRTRNYAWTRIENAGRSNELLFSSGSPLPPNFVESPIGHVAAYSFGYDRDYRIASHLLAAPGAQFTTYSTPDALVSAYGRHPFGAAIFVRLRITQ